MERGLPMDNWIKFTSTQAGRDKIYRLIQYFSRYLAFQLGKTERGIELAKRLSRLSVAMALGRKRISDAIIAPDLTTTI